jgi:hypothetical protein
MRTMILSLAAFTLLSGISATATSCRKKKKGNCYCDYASGDRTHYDLSMYPRDKQQDSCNVLDNNAGPFGGECKLK